MLVNTKKKKGRRKRERSNEHNGPGEGFLDSKLRGLGSSNGFDLRGEGETDSAVGGARENKLLDSR